MEIQNTLTFVQDDIIKTIDFNSGELKPTTTVLNFLRSSSEHKGTKEGCAEGDCGACTVVIGMLDKEDKIKYTAIDSCLVFLPMLHGKQLITVENLAHNGMNEEILHPVQKAMVETNGSQCGYCTPGIIMSLFALYKNENKPDGNRIRDALTGNLCRCTGYKPIVEAASNACVHNGKDHFTEKEIATRKLLLKIREEVKPLSVHTSEQHYYQPKTITDALNQLQQKPGILLINGSTDVALRVTKKHELLTDILDLSSIEDLNYFEKTNTTLTIGAGLNLEEIKSKTEKDLPALFSLLRVFGSRQIRSVATLGGNIGSASPIGDTIPVLMAYNATVHLQSLQGKRSFNMNAFISDYRQTKRNPDELIVAISIPVPDKKSHVKFYKVSKRTDLDISTVNGGFMVKLEVDKVSDVILAFGGMASTAKRATAAENFLTGKTWNRKTVEEASAIIYDEFTPLSDARSGAEFRKIAAKNLLLKFWDETVMRKP